MNKRTAVIITDNIIEQSVILDAPILAHEVVEALTPWFSEASAPTVEFFADCVARDEPLGELTFILGVTVETRTTEHELTSIHETARRLTDASAEVEHFTAARDSILRRAVHLGVSPTDAARAAGIARSRLYQILGSSGS